MAAAPDTYLVPTLITYEAISAYGARDGISPDNLRKIRHAQERAYDALALAQAQGLRIGSGSDLLGPMMDQKGREIACQAKVMGAMRAIVAATRTNAELLRLDREIGTVEEGKRADLILVSEDPLRDPAVLADPQRIPLVVLNGEIVKDLEAQPVPAGVR